MIKNIPGQVVDDSQVIWRYMDFASFYSLLLTQGLFFKRLDKYTDENEGTLSEETRRHLSIYRGNIDPYASPKEIKEWVERYYQNVDTYKVGTLANSWIANANESYAMWKIYLRGSNEGIAIKSTVGRLREALESNNLNVFLGKVTYEPLKIGSIDQFNVSVNKRGAYSYENEIRALVLGQFTMDTSQTPNIKIPNFDIGTTLSVSLEKLLVEVWISPFCGSWFYDIVESAIHRLAPPALNVKVMSSGIKDR